MAASDAPKQTPAPAAAPKESSALKAFISGGFGGMCLVLAGQPFDLVKVRLQTMVTKPGQTPPYTGAMDVLRKTLAAEGPAGLYKGVAAPLAGVTPIFAICFWAFELGKDLVRGGFAVPEGTDLSLMQIGLAGAFSAVPTTAIMAPGERIKVLLQTQGHGGTAVKYAGPVDCAKQLVKAEGIRSLFRGSGATLMRDAAGSLAYFSVYEGLKRSLNPGNGQLSPFAVLTAGGFAGVCNWGLAIPFDTVKSRIQAGSAPGGLISVGRTMIAEEGIGALFKGAGPAMLRAFPANAACFLGMEVSKSVLDKMF